MDRTEDPAAPEYEMGDDVVDRAVPTTRTGAGPLTDQERDVLDFEREWWKFAGAKEQAVRERFGVSSTRYYQMLNELIDRDDAVAYDPMLVKRLRRMRAVRQRQRAARRRGADIS